LQRNISHEFIHNVEATRVAEATAVDRACEEPLL